MGKGVFHPFLGATPPNPLYRCDLKTTIPKIRINYPLIAWRLEVAAIQIKSVCTDFKKRWVAKQNRASTLLVEGRHGDAAPIGILFTRNLLST
jgi:hypothetical protein